MKMTDEQREGFKQQMYRERWDHVYDKQNNTYVWQHIQGKQVNNQEAQTYWLMSGKCPVSGVKESSGQKVNIVKKALEMAKWANGSHNDTWVVDQMVRALTNCPMVTRTGIDSNGNDYKFESLGESGEYVQWIEEVMDGEDGAATYSWDTGIAP